MAEPILYVSPSDGGKGVYMTSGTRLLRFLGNYDTLGTGVPPSVVLNGYTGGQLYLVPTSFGGKYPRRCRLGICVVCYGLLNVGQPYNLYDFR